MSKSDNGVFFFDKDVVLRVGRRHFAKSYNQKSFGPPILNAPLEYDAIDVQGNFAFFSRCSNFLSLEAPMLSVFKRNSAQHQFAAFFTYPKDEDKKRLRISRVDINWPGVAFVAMDVDNKCAEIVSWNSAQQRLESLGRFLMPFYNDYEFRRFKWLLRGDKVICVEPYGNGIRYEALNVNGLRPYELWKSIDNGLSSFPSKFYIFGDNSVACNKVNINPVSKMINFDLNVISFFPGDVKAKVKELPKVLFRRLLAVHKDRFLIFSDHSGEILVFDLLVRDYTAVVRTKIFAPNLSVKFPSSDSNIFFVSNADGASETAVLHVKQGRSAPLAVIGRPTEDVDVIPRAFGVIVRNRISGVVKILTFGKQIEKQFESSESHRRCRNYVCKV